MAVITGTSGNDTLTGTSGDDQISGLDGNDILKGGGGADALDGGAGTDTASYETSSSGVVVDLYDGSQSTGDAIGDTFTSIEKFKGSNYADTFIASNNAEIFDGGLGWDWIDYSHSTSAITVSFNVTAASSGSGSGGAAEGDTFTNVESVVGSAYDDIYIIGTAGGSYGISEASGGGTDEIRAAIAAVNMSSLANVENLTYTGTGNFTGMGNSLNNVITGNTGNDTLIGGGGADTLIGGAGTDTASYETSSSGVIVDLYDGSQSTGDAIGDTFTSIEKFKGSNYNDTFIASNNAEIFDGGIGTDWIDYSHSTSAVTVSFNVTTANSGTGSGGAAEGDSFTNIEIVKGSAYDDIFIIGTAGGSYGISEASGGGTDEIRAAIAAVNMSSIANVENLTYTGTGNFTGTGNSLNNVITGNTGNDTLIGGGGADTLIGGAGTDTASYSNSTVVLIVVES